MANKPLYERVLLKISGEFFQSSATQPLANEKILTLAQDIHELVRLSVQVGVVLGAGNWLRGRCHTDVGLDRLTVDQMGMLATVMNALALRDVLCAQGQSTEIFSAIEIPGLAKHFDRQAVNAHLRQYSVVIFAGGTGNPLVTTDSAAALRSVEIGADILLKGTQVDGIYSADPRTHKDARQIKKVTYQEALKNEYAVMDLVAFSLCRDNHMPIRIFDIQKPGNLLKVVCDENEGTHVGE